MDHRRWIQIMAAAGLILCAAVQTGSADARPGLHAPLKTGPESTPTPPLLPSASAGNISLMAQRPGNAVELMADNDVSDLHLSPPPQAQISMNAASNFSVTYVPAGGLNQLGDACLAFPEEAKTPFDAAAQIWASYYQSGVPIVIEACWANLPAGVLGHSSAVTYARNFPNAPAAGIWYPIALANALANVDLDPYRPDISIAYGSSFASSFYYGTDGYTPVTRYDFESIVLHEITHGLGFSGTMTVNSDLGSWGYAGSPDAYDRYTFDGTGTALINTAFYPNPSVALGTVLTSEQVYFNAPQASSANGGQAVKLYAPDPWLEGSSYSHLDEIFNGTANALMTYSLSAGESLHNPGPVADAMLRDIGWLAAIGGTPTPTATGTPAATYAISGSVLDGNGHPLAGVYFTYGEGTVAISGADGNYSINGLAPGTYTILPAKTGYTFTPATRSVTITNASVSAQDFSGAVAAPAKASIRGKITGAGGAALAGVVVSAGSGLSAVTDAAGNYTFNDLAAGVYTLMPSKEGYTFIPVTRQVTVAGSDVGAQDFSAEALPAATYSLSGVVLDEAQNPLAGVIIASAAGRSTTTDTLGKYTLDGLPPGVITLVPAKAGYAFVPETQRVEIVSADLAGVNFSARLLEKGPYAIRGNVRDKDGAPLGGVVVKDGRGYTTVSDATGQYTMANLPAGEYVLSAAGAGRTFSAVFVNPLVLDGADLTSADFVAYPIPAGEYAISGVIRNALGEPLSGVAVSDARGMVQAVTDAQGAYRLANLPDGYFMIRAQRGSDVFVPAWRTVRLPQEDTSQDFQRVEEKIAVNTQEDGHDAAPGDGACASAAGFCTLRAALEEANAGEGAHVISLPSGNYALERAASTALGRVQARDLSGNLVLSKTAVLQGEGAETTIVDGKDTQSILEILPGAGEVHVTLSGITLENGGGAGIISRSGSGSLALIQSVVRKNMTAGIWVDQLDVIVQESQIRENAAIDATGGLDVNGGRVSLLASTVAENEGSGGGVRAGGGLVMVNSSVFANRGITSFGGIYAGSGSALVNSTVSGNYGREGGGVWTLGNLGIYSCTIVNNTAEGTGSGDTNSGLGGGLYIYPGSTNVNLRNSILSENESLTGAPDCFGTLGSNGYNLLGSSTGCDFCAGEGDQIGLDPGLGLLQDNGGGTLTHSLGWESWAVDAANPGGCVDQNHFALTADQRGSSRPTDGRKSGTAVCDAGAFEVQPPVAANEISGKIADNRGVPIPNVTVTLDRQRQTITDKDGVYHFSDLETGTYRLSAARSDYYFSPPRREIKLPPSRNKINFVGLLLTEYGHKISGTVTDIHGRPVADVSIVVNGEVMAISDDEGIFTVLGTADGIHVITPQKSGTIFTPTNRTLDLSQDVTEVNFTAED